MNRLFIRVIRPYTTVTKRISTPPSIYTISTVPKSIALSFHSNLPLNQLSKEETRDLERKANLGKLIEELKILLPNLLSKSLPKPLVSPEVLLRICPTHFDEFNAILPNIKGHVSYYTTLKSLQFVLTSLILNPSVKLHLQNIKVLQPQESTVEYLCVYPHTTKIQIRWSTCNEGCYHLTEKNTQNQHSHQDRDPPMEPEQPNPKSLGFDSNLNSTSYAKLGSHKWSQIDPKSLYKYHGDTLAKAKPKSLSNALAQVTKGFVGLVKNDDTLERVISGIFIFELNEDNTKIIVHTIEDVNIIEKHAPQEVGGLRIC